MKEGEVTSCQTSDVLYFSHLLRQKHVVLRHGQVVRAQKWNLEIVLASCYIAFLSQQRVILCQYPSQLVNHLLPVWVPRFNCYGLLFCNYS